MSIRRITSYFFIGVKVILLSALTWVLVNSALDIYNNFAYEKAIVKDSPYGGTPLLKNAKDYKSSGGFIKSGDYVYVEDWLSDVNGDIEFARVRSQFKEGYINKELLVKTNINLKPIFAVLILCS